MLSNLPMFENYVSSCDSHLNSHNITGYLSKQAGHFLLQCILLNSPSFLKMYTNSEDRILYFSHFKSM